MSQEKENEVKLQFLEEAEEYLDTIESGLLGLETGEIDRGRIDGVLRAAHSIKGGAAMMGFSELSNHAHHLEDFLKILKVGKAGKVDGSLESLFLKSVDMLRQVVGINRAGGKVEEEWEASNVKPVFEQLHARLGDYNPEDETNLLSEEAGEDMKVMLFETEVEACLQRLEAILASAEKPCLLEELEIAAQELGGLGEMLELTAFSSLAQAVLEQLELAPEKLEAIARAGLEAWRRSQALVLVGQLEALPKQIDLSMETEEILEEPSLNGHNLPVSTESLDYLLESDTFQEEAQDLFSSLTTTLPEAEPAMSEKLKNIELDTEKSPAESTIRVSLRQIEQLSDLFGELTIERNGLSLQLKSLRNLLDILRNRVKVLEQSNFRLRTAYDKVESTTTIAPEKDNGNESDINITSYFDLLEMDRYSDVHLLFQELMETIVQVQEVSSDLEINLEDAERNARELNRTSKLMQGNLTKVRMRPISDLIGRFPRALRDMSLQYGKEVELKVKGGSTLIDRSILEALGDPLLHLLRNAFDHGIEDPATRRAAGKPEKGTIEIAAAYRGNQTVITISDDGHGIDLKKIRAKIMAMGIDEAELIGQGEAYSNLRQRELLNLIFEPGFSTAEKVTDLSGRGVGMDIVRTNLRKIRGEVMVDTKEGLGTTFTITVPLTLSVVRVLLVESAGILLAFPTNAIEEMLAVAPEMAIETVGQEVLNWEGYMVPLIRLNEWLRFPSPPSMAQTEAIPLIDMPTVLMIAIGEDLAAIQVDRYWGEQEVTIRQVEGNIMMPPGFTGCTILGDGRVVPLVDAIALLRWIEDRGAKNSLSRAMEKVKSGFDAPSPSISQEKNTVMVVDDSINVRRFLALTLEKAGYRVEQAKDGQEAIEKLQSGIPVGAVVCDIEMPRLDGYGFLAYIKADPNCKNIPVAMLTSRSGNKHRQLAMNLGASAYFSKPFKEHELLQTLKKFTQKQLQTVN
ncbi:MAG: hybrid sensor histidine kinase/response regulator [Gomphosphaeria aponina SAG 52.96 = DSM 107014]|uniref:histidine kinase n=1 Tax=Gomphosphaeria aponina SAG 52.96 = DSM 107014 TaxID=1521640 RepID=A0A941GWN3_9CHRO|nr:hybrid sensor histidine kinase/response regulator [Gomphosphaeria aponina SAG 52.96 = DSM 107014]